MPKVKEDTYDSSFWDPPCFGCKHLLEVGKQRSEEGWTCKAFPEGIPYTVWSGHKVHDKVLDGFPTQVGKYVYEKVED